MAKDFYKILGLPRGASSEEIKKAYRRLSKELHPDKHHSTGSPSASSGQADQAKKEAEQKFKEVNAAYEVLSDPQKKQMFDQFGEPFDFAQGKAGFNGAAGGGGFGRGGAEGFDFSQFGGAEGFSDIFENFFGGGRRAQEARREGGRDIETEVLIDFAEAVSGGQRELKLKRLQRCDHCSGNGAESGAKIITCSECGGTGQVSRNTQSFFGLLRQTVLCPRCRGAGNMPETTCKKCDGEGRVSVTSTVTITVPAGIQDGQSLRLRGEGEAARRGATAGDLYVHIHVRSDARFERNGDDIRSAFTIDALGAILGSTVTVETVHGPVSLKIPEGTQPDQVFRLRGKGMPVLNAGRTGDHYVTVHVKIPTRLSREERKLLEDWRKIL